jgi:hypothetical protein
MDHERVELVGACRRTREDHLGPSPSHYRRCLVRTTVRWIYLRRACSFATIRPRRWPHPTAAVENAGKVPVPGGRPVATSQIERMDNGGRGRIAGTMNRVAPWRHLTSHRGEFLVAVPRIFCAHASLPLFLFSSFPLFLFPLCPIPESDGALRLGEVAVRRPGPGQMYLPCPEDVLHCTSTCTSTPYCTS